MLQYPVKLEPDTNGTMRVSFPDFPEVNTFGDDEDDAMARAVDALGACPRNRFFLAL
jgi:antitoxin HicB